MSKVMSEEEIEARRNLHPEGVVADLIATLDARGREVAALREQLKNSDHSMGRMRAYLGTERLKERVATLAGLLRECGETLPAIAQERCADSCPMESLGNEGDTWAPVEPTHDELCEMAQDLVARIDAALAPAREGERKVPK